MPCSDGGPSWEQLHEERGIKASWCAILTVLERGGLLDRVLEECDWNEAGVTKQEVLGWWAGHKRRDAERRAQETASREQAAVATAARQKLSPEEQEALGLR